MGEEKSHAGAEERGGRVGQGNSRVWPPEEAGLGTVLALGSIVMKKAPGSVGRWDLVEQ